MEEQVPVEDQLPVQVPVEEQVLVWLHASKESQLARNSRRVARKWRDPRKAPQESSQRNPGRQPPNVRSLRRPARCRLVAMRCAVRAQPVRSSVRV